MNLLALAERWGEAMGRTAVSFVQERCLHTADKFATCAACYDVCPVEAIQPEKPPAFIAERCLVCRACLPLCPVGAFTADDEAEMLINCAARIGATTCEIVCGLNPNVEVGNPAAAAIHVRGCLAGLGVSAYLALVSRGVERVIVRLDACANCPWSQLRSQVESQVQQAQGLLALWGRAEALTCVAATRDDFRKRPFYHAASPPVSRRDLFRWREAGPKPAAAPDTSAAPNPFHERLRFLKAVKQMPHPLEEKKTTPLTDLGFALASVTDDCTACGVCARACPTGALQMETAESSYRLTFSPQICLACDICSHVCAPNAISFVHDPTFDQVFGGEVDQVVQQGSLTRCSKCHTLFAARTEAQLCPLCEFRRQNRFGAVMPPGLAANQMKKNLAGAWRDQS